MTGTARPIAELVKLMELDFFELSRERRWEMKFIRWEPVIDGQHWVVGGLGGRRSGEIGQCVGIIALKHAHGYEVALEFEDGKVETFGPLSLFQAHEPDHPEQALEMVAEDHFPDSGKMVSASSSCF